MWYTLSQNLELSKVRRKNYNLPFHKSITRGRHFVPRNNQCAQWCPASSGSQTEYPSGLFVTSRIPAMQSESRSSSSKVDRLQTQDVKHTASNSTGGLFQPFDRSLRISQAIPD